MLRDPRLDEVETVGIDEKTGAIRKLRRNGREWATPEHPLALFSYQTLSADDYAKFMSSYVTSKADWAPQDFGKPNIAKFGAKNPGQAAAAFWSMGTIYEKQGDLQVVASHYKQYAERYASVDPARTAVAWAKVGLALYEHACPVKAIDGSCVKIVREARMRGSRPAGNASK